MRSNPLNNDRGPRLAGSMAIGGVALVALALGGLVLHARTQAARAQNVRFAVLAAGYGAAAVRPIKGDECWRARDGFTWRTASASGSACAGPRDEVHLFPGQPRPSLSGVSKLQDGGSRHEPL